MVFLSLLFWGCLEYTIVTKVTPDGRIIRTVIVKGDSADIFTGSFRVPSDTSWRISTRYEPRNTKDSTDSEVFAYEATKEFADVNDLNREFYNDSLVNDRNKIKVTIEKKSRGFYTHYYYTETYSMLFPFREVPVSEYLTDNELKIHMADEKDLHYDPQLNDIIISSDTANIPVLNGNDSIRFKELKDSIELRFEAWQKENIYSDFYRQVLSALDKTGRQVDSATNREPFYLWLDSTQTFESGIENADAFIEAAASYFNISPLRLFRVNQNGFDDFNRKFRVAAFSLESYTNTVIMPGSIVANNAKTAGAESSVTWTFQIENFYATDYVMTVESRLLNKKFAIIAGIVAIFLILLSLRYIRRTR